MGSQIYFNLQFVFEGWLILCDNNEFYAIKLAKHIFQYFSI